MLAFWRKKRSVSETIFFDPQNRLPIFCSYKAVCIWFWSYCPDLVRGGERTHEQKKTEKKTSKINTPKKQRKLHFLISQIFKKTKMCIFLHKHAGISHSSRFLNEQKCNGFWTKFSISELKTLISEGKKNRKIHKIGSMQTWSPFKNRRKKLSPMSSKKPSFLKWRYLRRVQISWEIAWSTKVSQLISIRSGKMRRKIWSNDVQWVARLIVALKSVTWISVFFSLFFGLFFSVFLGVKNVVFLRKLRISRGGTHGTVTQESNAHGLTGVPTGRLVGLYDPCGGSLPPVPRVVDFYDPCGGAHYARYLGL